MSKVQEVEVSKLKDKFYVREKLDDDRVVYLASLIEGGVELGPIIVTEKYEIIDGRNRTEAHKLMNLPTIKAIIEKDGNLLSTMKRAIELNSNGPLPPTRRDILHAMNQLLDNDYSYEKIIKEFSTILPRGMVRAIWATAVSGRNKKKVLKAVSFFREGKTTLEKAAEIVGIPLKMLQNYLNTLEKKKPEVSREIAENKRLLKARYAHFNKSNSKIVTKVFQLFDDGEIGVEEADLLFKYLGSLISNQNRIAMDWQKRWNARKG